MFLRNVPELRLAGTSLTQRRNGPGVLETNMGPRQTPRWSQLLNRVLGEQALVDRAKMLPCDSQDGGLSDSRFQNEWRCPGFANKPQMF